MNQWDSKILYKTSVHNHSIFIKENQLTYVLYNDEDLESAHDQSIDSNIHKNAQIRTHAYEMNLVNAHKNIEVISNDKESFYFNYFIGKDSNKWVSNVPIFKRVIQKNVYSNIDWVLHSEESQFKYDFILHPGAKIKDILIAYDGADEITLDDNSLRIKTSVTEIIEQKPFAYQIINNEKIEISCSFQLQNNQVSFKVGTYNKEYDLIIDPFVIMGTYSGALDQTIANCSTHDTSNNMYSSGTAINGLFPVTLGAYRTIYSDIGDIIVVKYNSTGTSMIFATYLGGFARDMSTAIVIDKTNRILVCGYTYSPDFPVTSGTIDVIYGGDTINRDAFISIFNNAGSILIASTFIGGTLDEEINDLKLDSSLNIYVCGNTNSSNFPVTVGVFDNTFNGNYDAFLCKINTNLTAIISSTFVGENRLDAAYGLSLDKYLNIYLLGKTNSPSFPTTPSAVSRTYRGAADAYVCRFNNSLNLLASTFIGTSYLDYSKFAINDSGKVYILGYTEGPFLPYPSCKASSGFGGVFLNCYKENLDSFIYSVPLTNYDVATNICAFELSDSNYFLVSTFLNLIRGTFPDSVYTTDLTGRLRLSLYIIAISKNAEEVYYASFINNYMAGHIHGSSSKFNKKNNRLFQVICSRNTETGTASAPYRTSIASGQYDMFSLIFQPTISIVTNYHPAMTIDESNYCRFGYVSFSNTSTGINSFKWIFPNGQTDSINRNIRFSRVLDGMNIVKLIVKRNCSTIDTLIDTFFIPARPSSLAVRLTDSIVCMGDTLLFTAIQISGDRNYWRLPTGIIDSTHDTIRYVANTTGLISFLLISDSISCPFRKDTTKLNFYVFNQTVANIIDIDTPICVPFIDSLHHNSIFYNRHLWYDDFGNFDSINQSFYINLDTIKNYNIYLITYNDVCNSISRDTFHIRSVLAPSSTIISSNSSGCKPTIINFNNISSNYNRYYWIWNDSIIDSSNNNINILFNEIGIHEIKLVCFSNYCEKSDTQIKLIHIFENPTSIIDTIITIACIPFTSSLQNSSIHSSKFYWIYNDSIIDSSSSILSLNYTVAGIFNYKLVVFGDSCTNETDTSDITIFAIDNANAFFSINDTSGCKPFILSIENTSTSSNQIQWILNDTNLTTTDDSIYLQFNNSGIYQLQLVSSNQICPLISDTASINIQVLATPDAHATLSNVVGCPPLNINISNTSFFSDSIYWSIDDSNFSNNDSFSYIFNQAGIYQIIQYAFNNTCHLIDTNFYNIEVLTPPQALISIGDSALCIPDSAYLMNSSNNYNHFIWNTPFIDSTNNHIYVSSNDSGLIPIQLIVYGDMCPHLSDTVIQWIYFKNQLIPILDVSDTAGCQNLMINAYLSISNLNNQWSTLPPSNLYFNRDSIQFIFNNIGLNTINISIYDPVCIEQPIILSQQIYVYPQTKSVFYYTPIYLMEDSFTYFINNSSYEDSLIWILDDSIYIINQDSIFIDSLINGSHQICLLTQNQYNCNDTSCQTIYVLKKPETPSPCTIEPVTAFTPNNDGINDQFFILAKSVENIQVSVYNRWGELVFTQKTTEDFSLRNDLWDGTFKGREQPMSNFTYIVTATCKIDHNKILKKGNVTLIR